MQNYPEWKTSPDEINVLDYIDLLIRACNEAGLSLSRMHLSVIKKMIEDQYKVVTDLKE